MRVTLLISLLSCTLEMYAQVVGGIPAKGLDMQAGPYGFVTELPMAPPETKGDVYLNSQWFVTDITLYTKTTLTGYLIRFNLETNDLQINYNNQIKILSGTKVHKFTWRDSNTNDTVTFVNGNEYKINEAPLVGFFEIKLEGNWSLLSKTNLVLIKNTYVAALDAGERNNKLVKREEFFLLNQSKVLKTDLSKKKFLAQFPSALQGDVKQFLSSNKIGTKNIGELLMLTEFLNTRGN